MTDILTPTCDHCNQPILPGEPHTPIPDGAQTSGPLKGCTVTKSCVVKMTEKSC